MKTVKAKLRLSRISSNVREDYANIEVVDRNSGDRIANIEMELAELGALISGLTINTPVTIFSNYDRLGLKREFKNLRLPYKWRASNDKFREEMQEIAKPYEVDGWKLKPEDFNHHRAKEDHYLCTFIRYVEGERDENER